MLPVFKLDTVFFAPNIPGYHRLTFEFYYEDGRVEYESPRVMAEAAGSSFGQFIRSLADTRYEPLREVVVKMLRLVRLAPPP